MTRTEEAGILIIIAIVGIAAYVSILMATSNCVPKRVWEQRAKVYNCDSLDITKCR